MGITRKILSASSAGLVDFRSDKERIARNTKKTYKAINGQPTTILVQAAPAAAPVTPPPGWYADNLDPYQNRWWNGTSWTEHTRPSQ